MWKNDITLNLISILQDNSICQCGHEYTSPNIGFHGRIELKLTYLFVYICIYKITYE